MTQPRFDSQRFSQARNTFQKNMPIGQQAYAEPFQKIFLPDNDFIEFSEQRLNESARPLNFLVNCTDTRTHVIVILAHFILKQLRSRLLRSIIEFG